jgi:pyruvate/2-oxoglutarate dehydrogenase complex dihydrolipoamide acyltransferase (E2) component
MFTMDVGRIGMRRHHVKALIEIDVTESRKKIRSLRARPGVKISFTAWILKCIGQALNEHRQVHALRKGRTGLVIFDTVDISILVEKEVDGVPVPLPLVLRDVANKSVSAIFDEIDSAKRKIIQNGSDYVLDRDHNNKNPSLYALLPQFIRLVFWRIILRNPFRAKKMMGTAVVTSVGMMGSMNGWIIPFSIHPVCFALGSIVKKPEVVNDSISIREYLKMTVLVDHDVVDGAPAARFAARLVELVEGGYGL